MKPQLSERAAAKIMEQLLERFGEPIGNAQGDGQGVPSGKGKKDMGNRGFGAKLAEAGSPAMCDQCGGMMGMDEAEGMCTQCGQMAPHMEPPVGGGGHVVPSPGGAEVPPVQPAVGMVAVTVKGGPGANKGGGGRFGQGLTVKDMDGIPTSGSGRGTQSSAKAALPEPAAPKAGLKPMPTEMMDEDESESEEDAQERLHFDLDHDGEIGEPKGHREKVLKGNAAELDEEEGSAPPSGGSSPPPSGGSGGGSTPPPATPKPPPTPPSGGSSGGGSSPPPSGGSGMDQGDSDSMMVGTKMDEDMDLADLDEKAPPGREKQVKALKKKKGVDNPFAVAWASYNKSHGK